MKSKDMKQKLASLRDENPDAFDKIVADYQENGLSAFELEENHREKAGKKKERNPSTLPIIWASVEFLMWRDRKNKGEAFDALASHGMPIQYYNTEAEFAEDSGKIKHKPNTWAVGREIRPEVYTYLAEGKPGKADGYNLRQSYYQYRNWIKAAPEDFVGGLTDSPEKMTLEEKLNDSIGGQWLEEMKAAYNGEESGLNKDFMESAFPPPPSR